MRKYCEMAIRNIAKTGDTDIFPFPIEKYLFADKPGEMAEILLNMDKNFNQIRQKSKVDTIQVSLPVGYTGYRWATLIDPIWNAFYLAEVLKIADQIEKKRIPVEEKTVFSYRLKYDEESGKLFDPEVSWKAYFKSAGIKSDKRGYVVMFDISDFYGRVSHKQMRDVLTREIKADQSTVDRIMDLLSQFSRGNEEHGLPIGGNASRILAEALLVRGDNFLKKQGIPFCRFVDDIILFADSPGQAHSLLNRCADFFLRELGLSLQKNKTIVLTKKEFHNHVKSVMDEIEVNEANTRIKDKDRSAILRLNARIDPYSLTADEALRDLRNNISGTGVIRLLQSECRKTRINQMFGKQLLRTIKVLEVKERSEALLILSENFIKLYPLFPLIMRVGHHLLPGCEEKTKHVFVDKVRELFEKDSYIIQTENNASYALRVLSLGDDAKTKDVICKIYDKEKDSGERSSDLIRVNALYAMISLQQTKCIAERQKDFNILSAWERRALLAYSSLNGKAGEKWKLEVNGDCSSFENLVGDWVSEKLVTHPNWNLPL